ncbi:hypothetical protein BJP62_03980 [Jeongeupia sp. USM3]|nr:hypothetical protein BJP62_03980 [Jeongeupia sp. USM3]
MLCSASPTLALLAVGAPAYAEDTVCAKVKIEIKQELTLERQAFDAEMKINNTTDNGVIENVSVVVKITDENGTPVAATSDPNDLSAKFFVRVSAKDKIDNVDGSGTVSPKSTAVINWLIIPAPGSAGDNPAGKKYLVGATLKYKFAGEEQTLDVSPDVITVKPLPLLTLDYFLPKDVWGDDPLTAEIEPIEPFTLGVRVKNNGQATAKNLKIDSAQPKIIENKQGLLINFALTGSYVNDAPAQNTLLINFGDIAGNTSKMGRWIMESSLAGKFTEFTAKFSHADELGGSLTSILQATNAHQLIRDVRVDLPGRDTVRDFLARDGDIVRVYESDGPDTEVLDRSAVAQLTAGTNAAGNASYRLVIPATSGFVYVRVPDPFNGQKALGQILRSDAKALSTENVWLSKTRNEQSKQWEYWLNLFDANTTGVYDTEFQAPPAAAKPPVIQFIADQVTKEEKLVSFLVEASSPDGRPVTLSAAPLPAGATFTPQATDPQSPKLARALFSWTPEKGMAGNYLVVYTATDGTLSATRSANIKVDVNAPPPGPGTPTIDSPVSGGVVTSLRPNLAVLTSTNSLDPAVKVQFELYKDEAMAQQVETALVDRISGGAAALPTTWRAAADLMDNTNYWWRARTFDGSKQYSNWVNGHFFVNLYNDAPDSFNLTSPAPNAEVAELQPVLSWTNAVDRDGDVVSYGVTVYKDAALTEVVTQVADLAAGSSGSTSWTVAAPLDNHVKYYWRVIAKDALGAQTPSIARPFVVNTGNTPPSAPVIVSPAVGGQSANTTTALTIQNSVDGEGDLITYVFELDTVNTFDSGDKRTSGQIMQTSSQGTSWSVGNLLENKHYYWRVKAQDGRAESAWVMGDFLMNAVNDAPPAPTIKNPGNAAWVASLQPSLEANPIVDPEGEVVRYQFEVYRDAGLQNKVFSSVADAAALIVPVPLQDKASHWWRVRALDAPGASSGWSSTSLMYVSTAPYQDPTIQVTAPVSPIVPDVVSGTNGARKQVSIRWEGVDPNIEATVALYYSTSNSSYVGNVIVDGLHQAAGSQAGTYVWDVTDLPVGTYYLYGVIYDAKGVGKAYAPGAVVIPPATQSGKIVVAAGQNLVTNEDGGNVAIKVRLGTQPTKDVVVPLTPSSSREAYTKPAQLVFTSQNWSQDQSVAIYGKNDCIHDGNQHYQVTAGKSVSLDPQYIGVAALPINLINMDNTDWQDTSNNPNINLCAVQLVSEREVGGGFWEAVLTAELTNVGADASAVNAQLTQVPGGITVVKGGLKFGAVASNETSKSTDTFTIRAPYSMKDVVQQVSVGFRWSVTTQP